MSDATTQPSAAELFAQAVESAKTRREELRAEMERLTSRASIITSEANELNTLIARFEGKSATAIPAGPGGVKLTKAGLPYKPKGRKKGSVNKPRVQVVQPSNGPTGWSHAEPASEPTDWSLPPTAAE